MSVRFIVSKVAGAIAAALTIFFDAFTSISGTDYSTDTGVNGTVTSDGAVASIMHTSETGSYAMLTSVATYTLPFFALISCKFDAGIALSLRRLGFADADWSDGIFIRMNGTTYQFVVKAAGTETTYTITDDLTAYSDWIIHVVTGHVRLYLGDTLKVDITTNIPTGALYFKGRGEKQ